MHECSAQVQCMKFGKTPIAFRISVTLIAFLTGNERTGSCIHPSSGGGVTGSWLEFSRVINPSHMAHIVGNELPSEDSIFVVTFADVREPPKQCHLTATAACR